MTFPDPVHEFDTSDGDRGVSEPLQAEHWTQAKLDRSMILFNEVVQIFRRSNLGPRVTLLFEEFTRRPMRSLISIERDFVRQATLARERPPEKRFGGGDISFGAKQEIHSFSRLVDGAVEIDPTPLDLDVGLVDAPRSAGLASEAVPPFFELWNIALDPAHDRRMSQRQSAFGHHFHEIPKAELVSQIPTHTENDDLPVEMAAFEKIIDAQHRGYPSTPVAPRPGNYAPLAPFAPEPAHAAGGLPSERLLARLAMPVSDNAILRQLKRHVRERADPPPLRAIAIDDWSWRKGSSYGTIVVDLERRTVADVLATRSAKETADWLERRPEIEIVSRDRSGLYAQGIRQGAPQARQVADRFHLLQNLRESIERQMTAVSCFGGRSRLRPAPGDRQSVLRSRSRDARELMFEQAKDLHASGKSFVAIAAEIGVGHRTIAKWVEADALPHRRRLTLKPSSPLYFQDFLARRWAEGDKVGSRLFHDIRHRGYTGSRSHLERLLSEWRRAERPATSRPRESTREDRAIDPATGWQISPVVAAALCMKPTRMLTHSQAAKVAVLKEASPSFVVMRRLAMRFRGLLRSSDPGKLGSWLDDARHSGIQLLQQFARILSRDIDAVRNAISEPWSSGQAEGQINRLKTLKRAMFGRAGIELLRARMLPIQ